MTGAAPVNPPVILLSDKLVTITNLTTHVPVLLDIDEMNYSSWTYFFQNLCRGYNLLPHILGESKVAAMASDPTPPTDEWLTIDSIILTGYLRYYAKLSYKGLLLKTPTTAKEAWDISELIFNDNKRSHSIALKAELHSMKLDELSIDAYFCKIESIATILYSLGSPISNDDVVNIALDGLPNKYHHVSDIIIHRDPFPDLKTVRSMFTTAEMRLKSRAQASYVDSTSSSPMVLLAKSRTNNRRSTYSMEKTPTDIKNDDMRTLQTLMAKLGFDSSTLSPVSNPTNTTGHIALHTNTTGPAQQFSAMHSPPGFFLYQTQPYSPSAEPAGFNGSVGPIVLSAGSVWVNGSAGTLGSAGWSTGFTCSNYETKTLLPNAFHAVTLQEPAPGNWSEVLRRVLLRLDSYTSNMCIQSLGTSCYARALIEIKADVKFKDTIVLKKPSQTPRGVPVGSNVGFKPTKKYRPVAKKPNANTSCNKKKGVKPTKETSMSARIQGPTPVMVFAIILLRVTIVIVCKVPSGMEK
uniref:Hybrid signal transduction histidine kinase M n=1 Tax=Tanacetum cinerariifolium TaxID=118510 RepID=A0A699HYC7_TANCI|nr:hybrid signal transduction histidine kinase M [Tanacetum cinerariifolium]